MFKDCRVRLLRELIEKARWSLSKLAGELGTVVAGLAVKSELSDPETAAAAAAVGVGRFLTISSDGAITLDTIPCVAGRCGVMLEARAQGLVLRSEKGSGSVG
jgi:hypothetical protein